MRPVGCGRATQSAYTEVLIQHIGLIQHILSQVALHSRGRAGVVAAGGRQWRRGGARLAGFPERRARGGP
jgi:hypothetical protein